MFPTASPSWYLLYSRLLAGLFVDLVLSRTHFKHRASRLSAWTLILTRVKLTVDLTITFNLIIELLLFGLRVRVFRFLMVLIGSRRSRARIIRVIRTSSSTSQQEKGAELTLNLRPGILLMYVSYYMVVRKFSTFPSYFSTETTY